MSIPRAGAKSDTDLFLNSFQKGLIHFNHESGINLDLDVAFIIHSLSQVKHADNQRRTPPRQTLKCSLSDEDASQNQVCDMTSMIL